MMLSQNSSSKEDNGRGAMTVFISIVLGALLLVTGAFVDGARLRLAGSQVGRAGNSALSSLLACYHNELKDQYGLFGLYLDSNTLEDSFGEYFRKNLNIGGQNYLYDYQIEAIDTVHWLSLLNGDVFEQQIMEFMKYRAPYEIASELISKIDGIKNISKGANLYKRKIETDKQADDIGELQLSLDEKTKQINSVEGKKNLDILKGQYTSRNTQQSEYYRELDRLQSLYSNEKDGKKKNSLLKELNSVQQSIDNLTTEKAEIKNTIVEHMKQLGSINSQAQEQAAAISDRKEVLLQRIDAEIEYTREHQEGIKELAKSYKENLTNTKEMLKEDNSSTVVDLFKDNANKCRRVIDSADSSDGEFIQALESMAESPGINYTFNQAKSIQTNDKDIRDDVVQALQEAFTPLPELKSIDQGLLDQLPSRTYYREEQPSIRWEGTNLNDMNCVEANLENLSSKEGNFEQLLSKVIEEMYLNRYIMGTFKHGVPNLKGEKEKSSYNLRAEDKTKRDALFSTYEVEYIIGGNRKEAVNALLVKSEILAVRLVSNVLHIYSDSSKMARVSSLAVALSTWSAGLSTPLIQTALVFAWAMTESLYDMELLEKGEKVMLYKTSDHWRMDMSGSILKNTSPNIENNPFCLSYHDYLEVFLLLTDSEKKLSRVQDLIQLNLGISNPGFLMEDCKAVIWTDTVVSMKNIFLPSISFAGGSGRNSGRSYIQKSISMKY